LTGIAGKTTKSVINIDKLTIGNGSDANGVGAGIEDFGELVF